MVGIPMRALGGAGISEEDVVALQFEADAELLAALNDAGWNSRVTVICGSPIAARTTGSALFLNNL